MRPPREEMLFGWGMANRGRSLVYSPLNAEEVGAAVADAGTRGLSLTARGTGLSYGDAALNQGGAVLDMRGMNRILELDPHRGIARAEAGVTIEDLWTAALPKGWWPAVVPGTMRATLGGCVAMNVHGKNHVGAGAVGRWVHGVGLVTGTGEERRLDRGVVAEGSELWSLGVDDVVGAQGLTGTITDVTIQLRRVHSGYLDVEGRPTSTLDETFEALDRGAREADYAVAWVDCMGRRAGRGVIHSAWYLAPDDAQAGEGMDVDDQRLPSRLAGVMPRRHAWVALRPLTNGPGIRALNVGKYAAARVGGVRRYRQSHAAFHFLLDYMPGWKRAYGSGGLLQYQLFVPGAAAPSAFRAALDQQRATGFSSYLGVMKRHTPEDGAAAYPVDGYSLAMDFPVRRGNGYAKLKRLMRSLDDIGREHGAEVYAAKDAVSVGTLPARRDPAFSSNLVRRWERGGAGTVVGP